MKRKTMIILALSDTALGVAGLYRGLSEDRSYYVLLGVGWLLLAAVWAVRAVRQSREKQQQDPKAPPDEGT